MILSENIIKSYWVDKMNSLEDKPYAKKMISSLLEMKCYKTLTEMISVLEDVQPVNQETADNSEPNQNPTEKSKTGFNELYGLVTNSNFDGYVNKIHSLATGIMKMNISKSDAQNIAIALPVDKDEIFKEYYNKLNTNEQKTVTAFFEKFNSIFKTSMIIYTIAFILLLILVIFLATRDSTVAKIGAIFIGLISTGLFITAVVYYFKFRGRKDLIEKLNKSNEKPNEPEQSNNNANSQPEANANQATTTPPAATTNAQPATWLYL